MKLGKSIAIIRYKSGLSQDALASLINISRVYLSSIETGRVRPGKETLEQIAAATGVDVPFIELIALALDPMSEKTRGLVTEVFPDFKNRTLSLLDHVKRVEKNTFHQRRRRNGSRPY